MNAGKAVYGILSTNTGVTDIVSTRIYPEIAEQEAPVPFIVYQVQNVAPEDTHDGPSTLDEVRFEFLCYDATYNGAAELGDKVRGALDRVQGTYNTVNVQSVQFNDVDTEIIDEPRRYAQILTFTFRIARDNFEIAQGTPVTGAMLGDLYDVNTTGVTDGQVIAYDAATSVWLPATGAGGVETLEELTDVNIIGEPDQGDVISYNTGTDQWMRNGGLQQLLARFKASGTGAQMYDTLNDTTKGYVDILADSATMKVNNSGMTITEASPGVLSLSVAAGTEGNEVEFEAFVITGSDTSTTASDIVFKYGSKTYWEIAGGKKIFLRALNVEDITVVLPSTAGQLALTTQIPDVPVDSVNGQTGAVVLDTGDIDEDGNLYYTEARVEANSAVVANTAKVGITPTQASEIAANTLKVGITTQQASDITANNAKTGITTQQASDITTNNAKNSYPSADASKLAGIEDGAEVNTVDDVTGGTGLTASPTTGSVVLNLDDTAVTAGAYTSANITVDAQGRITAAANGSGGGGGVTAVTGTAPIVSSGGSTPAISIAAATTTAAGSMSGSDKLKLNLITTNYEEDELNTGQNILMNTSVGTASNKIVDIMADALADTSNANSKKLIGFHTGSGVCVLQGMVDAVSTINGATQGGPLWIGASGVFSSAPPTTANYYSRVVGYYVGIGQGGKVLCYFDPSKDWVQIS